MHLIQGTLDTSTTLMTTAAGIFAIGAACYGARRQLKTEQLLPLMGMTTFVFIAQMVNFSTGFGFSSHLLGAALLAILFSPCAAMLSMAVILTLQVTLLGDGSWSTLGANFMTIGVVAPWAACAVFRFMQGIRAPQVDLGQVVAVTLASIISVIASSVSVGLLVGGVVFPILSVAIVWGAFEAVLSVTVFVLCVRGSRTMRLDADLLKPMAVACIFALCFVPFSSKQSDGIEYVIDTSEISTD